MPKIERPDDIMPKNACPYIRIVADFRGRVVARTLAAARPRVTRVLAELADTAARKGESQLCTLTLCHS